MFGLKPTAAIFTTTSCFCRSIDQYQSDSFPGTETAKADRIVTEMEEKVQALERKLSLQDIVANITEEPCNFSDRNFR